MPNDDTELSLLNNLNLSNLERSSTRQPSISNNEISLTYSKHASSKLFLKLLLLWVGTIFWAALVVAIVKIYQAKGVITPAQKTTYNFLTLVLILILSLSFFEAFKELARGLQGKLYRKFDRQEKERVLIQHFDSLLKVIQLTYATSNWWLRLFCIVWAAQISTAFISLEVSMTDGTNYNNTYTRNGSVSVSNLTCYTLCGGCPSRLTTHALAHAYGETTLALKCGNDDVIADVTNSKQEYPYYCPRDSSNQEFAYRFKEYNPADVQEGYPWFTQRIITAASGHCNQYDQIGPRTPDVFYDEKAYNFKYGINSVVKGNITIPISRLGREGTTYIYQGIKEPSQATIFACGLRCIWIWAYENEGEDNDPKFYECPITVSVVRNATQPEHDVPDAVAKTAAASIALQGRYFGDHIFKQYQFYASGSPWEVHNQSADRVGANMAKFAIGSLSTMVSRNSNITIPGTVPYLGSHVKVENGTFEAILTTIVVAHFIVFTLTFWVAR